MGVGGGEIVVDESFGDVVGGGIVPNFGNTFLIILVIGPGGEVVDGGVVDGLGDVVEEGAGTVRIFGRIFLISLPNVSGLDVVSSSVVRLSVVVSDPSAVVS